MTLGVVAVAKKAKAPKCIGCDTEMTLSGNRWVCPEDGWWMPVDGLCPTCFSTLPPNVDEDGARICTCCGFEVWPPRDEPEQTKETWYQPPGMDPYRVGSGAEVLPQGPPKKLGGRSGKSRYKNAPQQRLENWRRKNPMSRRMRLTE